MPSASASPALALCLARFSPSACLAGFAASSLYEQSRSIDISTGRIYSRSFGLFWGHRQPRNLHPTRICAGYVCIWHAYVQDMYAFGWLCMHSAGCVCIRQAVYEFGRLCMHSAGYVCTRQAMYALGTLCMNSAGCVCIRQAVYDFGRLCMNSAGCVCIWLAVYAFGWLCMHSAGCV